MSLANIVQVLDDTTLVGEERLAMLSVANAGGEASAQSIMQWANVTETEANKIIDRLVFKGWLSWSSGGGFVGRRAVNLEMLDALYRTYYRKEDPYWPISPKRRDALYERDGRKCHYCGATYSLSLDHKIPRSKGGKSDDGNLVTCCLVCNQRKKTKSYDEFLQEVQGRK